MKANETPEKIYLYSYSTDGIYEVETKPLEGTIEYTRTDAFIEKACEYLMEYEFNDSPTIVNRRKRVDEFIKYMENKA